MFDLHAFTFLYQLNRAHLKVNFGKNCPKKRVWCWERLKAGREGDDRGWDGWMASPTWWTWIWASSGSWWWTGKPDELQSMGSPRVRHDWATKLNWYVSDLFWDCTAIENCIRFHLLFHIVTLLRHLSVSVTAEMPHPSQVFWYSSIQLLHDLFNKSPLKRYLNYFWLFSTISNA